MNIFVTGTDTNVGKTWVSGHLCRYFSQKGETMYIKPIQTGLKMGDIDEEEVKKVARVKTITLSVFQEPVSPHFAAALEKKKIDPEKLSNDVKKTIERESQTEHFIVEGAGGLMVPITDRYWMIDLISDIQMPVILIARATLGTLNHSLLSIEALERRKVPLKGIILSEGMEKMSQPLMENNLSTLKKLCPYPTVLLKKNMLPSEIDTVLDQIFSDG